MAETNIYSNTKNSPAFDLDLQTQFKEFYKESELLKQELDQFRVEIDNLLMDLNQILIETKKNYLISER